MIETRIVKGILPSAKSERQIAAEVKALLEAGAKLEPAGKAKRRPGMLFDAGYVPRHRVDLFDTTYYLSNLRVDRNFRFFVAYVHLGDPAERRSLYARIFYKDVSLVWRSASHFVRSENENWIGKGEARWTTIDGEELLTSAEQTTDLPLEIQTALEVLLQRGRPVRSDHVAVERVLRAAATTASSPSGTSPRRANAPARTRRSS